MQEVSVDWPGLQGAALINRRAEYFLFSVALGIFFLGALVYLFDRSAGDIYFIPEWWRFADGTPSLFGALGGSLPSFAHTYCFILLFSALLTPWSIPHWAICVGWCTVEALCELAQTDAIASRIVPALPEWFADWPILANVPGYFINGRFDPADLAAIGFGGLAAWLTLIYFNRYFAKRTGAEDR
jgi:hypothetical protein